MRLMMSIISLMALSEYRRRKAVPDGDHVVVHLLQLLFCRFEDIWGRVEFVGLEALVGEPDFEGLVIFLSYQSASNLP
jgi:hypothetical protein